MVLGFYNNTDVQLYNEALGVMFNGLEWEKRECLQG